MSETTPHPPGDYAIVELFGHTTLVGRISEVERFGTKMLAIEPLFNDAMLTPVLHGGAAIYRLTPCSADTAYAKQPRRSYQIPSSILCIVPPAMLEAPSAVHDADIDPDACDDDDMPF